MVLTRRDFLGRVTIPTVAVLHPPDGGPDDPITLPLLSLNQSASLQGETTNHTGTLDVDNKNSSVNIGGINSSFHGNKSHSAGSTRQSKSHTGLDGPKMGQTTAQQPPQPHHGGAAGRLATRMMTTVQKHVVKSDAITGTLTVSLQIFDDDKEDVMTTALSAETGGGGEARSSGVNKSIFREPPAPRELKGYAAMKFKIAEDAAAAKRRREREGIRVPRMLARVQALHDRLDGNNAKTEYVTTTKPLYIRTMFATYPEMYMEENSYDC